MGGKKNPTILLIKKGFSLIKFIIVVFQFIYYYPRKHTIVLPPKVIIISGNISYLLFN